MHTNRQISRGFLHKLRAVRGYLHGVHRGALDAGNRAHERGFTARTRTQVEPAASILTDERGLGHRAGNELRTFILDRCHSLAHRLQRARVTLLKVNRIGRVPALLAAGHERQLFRGDLTRARDEVHDGTLRVRLQRLFKFVRTPERASKGTGNPLRMRVTEGESWNLTRWAELVQPLTGRGARNGAHNTVGKALGLLLARCFDEAHRGVDGSVRLHTGVEHLVGTQAQCGQYFRGHGIESARRALGDDRVEHAFGTQGAVGQLRGECSISAVDLVGTQGLGQREIGKGIVCINAAEHIKSHRARHIHSAPASRLDE